MTLLDIPKKLRIRASIERPSNNGHLFFGWGVFVRRIGIDIDVHVMLIPGLPILIETRLWYIEWRGDT